MSSQQTTSGNTAKRNPGTTGRKAHPSAKEDGGRKETSENLKRRAEKLLRKRLDEAEAGEQRVMREKLQARKEAQELKLGIKRPEATGRTEVDDGRDELKPVETLSR